MPKAFRRFWQVNEIWSAEQYFFVGLHHPMQQLHVEFPFEEAVLSTSTIVRWEIRMGCIRLCVLNVWLTGREPWASQEPPTLVLLETGAPHAALRCLVPHEGIPNESRS